MSIWALADLHLAFSVPNKSMEVFGPRWEKYAEKIDKNWRAIVQQEDLVLIPGDISWAKRLEESLTDLKWIDALPGTKLLLKGNHDYWWSSLSKMEKALPASIHVIYNNAFYWKGIAIGGARLWDTPEYNFNAYIETSPNLNVSQKSAMQTEDESDEKIFKRELSRLELSLQAMRPDAQIRIAMTHYPPIGADLSSSQAADLLEKYRINICVFGHLHNVRDKALPFGERNGIRYHLVAGDYLNFTPLKIF